MKTGSRLLTLVVVIALLVLYTLAWIGRTEFKKKKSIGKKPISSLNLSNGLPLPHISTTVARQIENNEERGNRDLAIGMATGVHELNLAVFVKSLREFSSCDIVLFVGNTTQRVDEFMKVYNVTAIKLNLDELEPPKIRQYHPSSYRWILKSKFLNTTRRRYHRILMADIRDTAFQSNPFDIVQDPGLYVFAEGVNFADEGWNEKWVAQCFGDALARSLRGKPVICSGISIGTSAAVSHYLATMSATLTAPDFQACESNGVDQGLHNVLVHTSRLPSARVLSDADGPVAHMQNTLMLTHGEPPGPVTVHSPTHGRPAAIVHQYDRRPPLQAYLFSRYLHWDSYPSSPGAAACRGYRLAPGLDLLQGQGDLADGHLDAPDPDACCAGCARRGPACRSFVFVRGKGCWLKSAARPTPLHFAMPVAAATTAWQEAEPA